MDNWLSKKYFCCVSSNYVWDFLFRYAKYVDLENSVLTTEEDKLIQKVLTDKKTKRKLSIDDENEISCAGITTTETVLDEPPFDENDMKWAANYIEEQQTQLILSILDDKEEKSTNIDEDENDDDDDDVNDEPQNKEEDYKFLRPSLETMGLGKLLIK